MAHGRLLDMTFLFWIAAIVSIIAFGGLTKGPREYKRVDGIWIWLFVFSYVAAIWLSGRMIITAIVLFFGNGLFWAVFWGVARDRGSNFRRLIKAAGKKEEQEPPRISRSQIDQSSPYSLRGKRFSGFLFALTAEMIC